MWQIYSPILPVSKPNGKFVSLTILESSKSLSGRTNNPTYNLKNVPQNPIKLF